MSTHEPVGGAIHPGHFLPVFTARAIPETKPLHHRCFAPIVVEEIAVQETNVQQTQTLSLMHTC